MENFGRIQEFGEHLHARMARAGDEPLGDAEFDELALELFRRQAACMPTLERLAARRGLILSNRVPWQQLPAIPTRMFKELDLSCIPEHLRSTYFLSSGTTSEARSRHWHGDESMRLYERSLMTWFHRNHRVERHRFLSLTPDASAAPNSSLVHMFDQFRLSSGCGLDSFFGRIADDGSWQVDFEGLFNSLKSETRPVFLVGTAFAFVHVLDEMKARGLVFELPSGSRLMETGGYKGRSRVLTKEELHGQMRIGFSVRSEDIVCEYGMSELSSQAYDVLSGGVRVFRFPSWARVLLVSPETGREVGEGEVGILRVCDLANTFSVMAVQTEDLAIRTCGGFQLKGRLAEAEPRGCSLMAA